MMLRGAEEKFSVYLFKLYCLLHGKEKRSSKARNAKGKTRPLNNVSFSHRKTAEKQMESPTILPAKKST